jgi:hypothetical protein
VTDDNPAPWSAQDAWSAAPRCPMCGHHDHVERDGMGEKDNRVQVWYCNGPFCHSVFKMGETADPELQRIHRGYFAILRGYLATHPEARRPSGFTDELLAREPATERKGNVA